MARKDRAPNPPKRPQGPQRRSTPSGPRGDAQQRRLLYLIAGAGVVALAVVLGFIFVSGGDDDERATLESAGCTLQSFPALSNQGDHSDVPTLTTKPHWNSNPPTSGPHYGQWAVWNFYDSPVPLTMSTHNLEHGGIVIHYGPNVPQSEVSKLREFYNGDPNAIVVAPLPTAGNKIYASAWYYDESKQSDRTFSTSACGTPGP